MSKRTLLWVDLTIEKSRVPATRHFEDFFAIRWNSPDLQIQADNLDQPDALCFDFDFPDKASLALLVETKRLHPSIPILMLMVQHSEELAVWAFRSRVWDYFTKPVARCDVQRCYDSLCKIDTTVAGRGSIRTHAPVPAVNNLSRIGSSDKRALAPAVAYVASNYAERIVQSQLATMCGMSAFRFSRLFHTVFGLTFQNYLLQLRLGHAEQLLLNPGLTISDVGYAVGFHDPSYFGRVFRKRHNMSPTQWRHHQMKEERVSLHVDGAGPGPGGGERGAARLPNTRPSQLYVPHNFR